MLGGCCWSADACVHFVKKVWNLCSSEGAALLRGCVANLVVCFSAS